MIIKFKYTILLLFILIPTFAFLLSPNIYWNMHDDMQIIRQLELEKCIQDGQIPCRWSPDLGFGYGYPLFNYYPPLPYLIGEFYRIFGFSFVTVVKLTAVTQIIASASAMFILGSAIFGPFGGLISSIFYAYAPYRAVNIYVRGAMNEAWASVFFPLIFYFSQKIITTKEYSWKNILLLSLSISGLLLSHNPMAITFLPFVAIWCIYWMFVNHNFNKIFSLFISSILGLALSAYYTLPVLFESKLVQIESMFINYYHYSVHFVSINQLFFSNFWGDGPSVWGPNDGMPFMVGYIHWLIPVLLIIISIYHLLKKQNQSISKLTLLLGFMGIFAIFMTHQKSWLLWQYITPIQKIQFPWRFLSHSSFLLALTAGSLGIFTKNNKILITIITITIFFLNWSHFLPITSGPVTDNQKLTGLAWQNQITSGIYDYLPKTASTAAKKAASPYVDEIQPPTSKYQLSGQKKGTDWQLFNISLDTNSTLTLPILYFPNYVVTDFGKLIKSKTEPVLGRITIDLLAGNHQIYIKLHNTPIRTLSNLITIVAWIFTIYFFVNSVWSKSKLKK